MKQLLEPLEDRYQHIKLLHEGATVSTYAAEQAQAPNVVIKMLDFKKIQAWKALELFEREATVLRGLSHPAIPEYIDAFQANFEGDSYYCLVQKSVEGQTLQHWIDAGHRFTEAEIKVLATQLLEVLIYLHAFNPPIIHRDIKPDNLIWHNDKLSVLDFGAVLKHLGPAQSTVVGTYGYMAPEQFQGKARIESDLYSVGMTLAYALSHVHPSEMDSHGLSINIAPHLKCSENLLRWLIALTALVADERFNSAQNALDALLNPNHKQQQPGLAPLPPPSNFISAISNNALEVPSPMGYILEKHAQKTLFSAQEKNSVSVKTALQIDLIVSLPAVAVFGLFKLVGYSWLMSALLPSVFFLPIIAFFFLTAHYSQLELEITPDGWAYKKKLWFWTLQRNEGDLDESCFEAIPMGPAVRKPSPEAPALLKITYESSAVEYIVHMGLPLKHYAYIANSLNAEMQNFHKT